MTQDIRKIKECPECASKDIVYIDEKMQVICQDCGLVYEPLDPETERKFEKTHGIKTHFGPKKGKQKHKKF